MLRALIVGTEWREVQWLLGALAAAGYGIRSAPSLEKAHLELGQQSADLVLADDVLPDGCALDLLPALESRPHTALVVMAAPAVAAALHEEGLLGLSRPLDRERFSQVIARVAERITRRHRDGRLRAEVRRTARLGALVGQSRAMQSVFERILRVAAETSPVFISGGPGTGKELVARTIHEIGPHADGPFVAVDCAAGGSAGEALFEEARGGTLFLDGVSELPLELQAALVRVLDLRDGCTLASAEDPLPGVRMIAATAVALDDAAMGGKLRADLLYRLLVLPIELPSLRERRGDVELLAAQILAGLNRASATRKRFSDGALERLRRHSWPGNVRELRNVIERAFLLSSGQIDESCLSLGDVAGSSGSLPVVSVRVGMPIGEAERHLILATLEHMQGDKKRAARTLGISLKTLYNRLNEYARQ